MKQWYDRAVQFIKEIRSELGKVSWPSRNELLVSTLAVIFFSIVLAGFIGVVDFSLVKILEAVSGR